MLNQQPNESVHQLDMVTVWMETLHTDLQCIQKSLRTLIEVVQRNKVDQ